jgi:predicted ATPase
VLDSLRLRNFRGFDDHLVPLRELTIIVGENNAGKSTIVEALRLVALVVNRFRRGGSQFVGVPDWLNHPDAHRGIQPVRRGRGFEGHGRSTFHAYNPPPAIITANFSGGASAVVFVGPDGDLHGVARDPHGTALGTGAAARNLSLTPIWIQPQVGPLLRDERILAEATVRRGVGTYLTPLHFRNQLRLFEESWGAFTALAEETWPGLAIRALQANEMHPDEPIELELRDTDFVGEVSLMGHGLQMWLQMIWFLSRAPAEATVVLDEPDVYMHPDIQRRLLEVVRARFAQLLIATHSIEILADVEPDAILAIDRRQPESVFASDVEAVQAVVDSLGGVHSIQVTRLMRSKSAVLVEGKDIRILRILQRTLDPSAIPLDLRPNFELGGRGGLRSGNVSVPRTNRYGEDIRVYALLDHDYYPDDELDERRAEAQRESVELHIWQRKEIENYLLVPEAIARVVASEVGVGVAAPSASDVATALDDIAAALRVEVTDCYGTQIQARDRRLAFATARQRAEEIVEPGYQSRAGAWAIVSGKNALSRLSAWSQLQFGVSFGSERVARELRRDEIPAEIAAVIRAIGSESPLP